MRHPCEDVFDRLSLEITDDVSRHHLMMAELIVAGYRDGADFQCGSIPFDVIHHPHNPDIQRIVDKWSRDVLEGPPAEGPLSCYKCGALPGNDFVAMELINTTLPGVRFYIYLCSTCYKQQQGAN